MMKIAVLPGDGIGPEIVAQHVPQVLPFPMKKRSHPAHSSKNNPMKIAHSLPNTEVTLQVNAPYSGSKANWIAGSTK
ncbi:MAG: hypothetical protein EBW18_08555, partial [Burkholderiaceae bacterium]|nr:hypothetical protein [Burkholderiaceae bacterium]